MEFKYKGREKEYMKKYMKKYYEEHKVKWKKHYEEHKEEIKAYNKAYHKKYLLVEDNNKRNRIRAWQKHRIIDPERFEELYEKARGQCEMCGTPLKRYSSDPDDKEIAHLDHDPCTGMSRGILCRRCNISVGFYESDRDLIQKYLYRNSINKDEYICAGSHHWVQ